MGLDACALLVKEGSSSSTSMSESEFGLSLLSESERVRFLGEGTGVADCEWNTSCRVSFADWKMRGDFEGDGLGDGAGLVAYPSVTSGGELAREQRSGREHTFPYAGAEIAETCREIVWDTRQGERVQCRDRRRYQEQRAGTGGVGGTSIVGRLAGEGMRPGRRGRVHECGGAFGGRRHQPGRVSLHPRRADGSVVGNAAAVSLSFLSFSSAIPASCVLVHPRPTSPVDQPFQPHHLLKRPPRPQRRCHRLRREQVLLLRFLPCATQPAPSLVAPSSFLAASPKAGSPRPKLICNSFCALSLAIRSLLLQP